MSVTLLFCGVIMMAVTSMAQDHPGNPANGTCVDCNDVMYDNGVWHNVCTEDFTCPLEIADIENRIIGKDVTFNATYYFGNAAFVPGTRHYEYNAILASQIDSIKKNDIGTDAVSTDNCQRCEVNGIEDTLVQCVCTIVDCPSAIAEEIELKSSLPENTSSRDRMCLIRKDDMYTIYTCQYYSDDPDMTEHVIQAST